MDTDDLIGRGLVFPLEINSVGSMHMVQGKDLIESAIRMILSTAPGERVYRPEFGCSIWDFLFEPISTGTLGACERAVLLALERWEPRIDVLAVVGAPGEQAGEVMITIDYVVKADNDRRNLVFPFYLIPRDGEDNGVS